MDEDGARKTCLHWAAQFGHLKAIELILSRLDRGERTRYLEALDVNGWTPLCWAMRAYIGKWIVEFGSEESDFVGSVRCLLKHGAKPDVECRIGKGNNAERFTPLLLAQLYESSVEIKGLIMDALIEHGENADVVNSRGVEPILPYVSTTVFCDFCPCVSLNPH